AWVSHMLGCQLFGQKAGAHYLMSLLLDSANVVLLFLLLDGMTGSRWKSAFVAGLFALHPLHVESVAWVSERKDVLSGFFFFLTLWAYAKYAQQSTLLRRDENSEGSLSADPPTHSTAVELRCSRQNGLLSPTLSSKGGEGEDH